MLGRFDPAVNLYLPYVCDIDRLFGFYNCGRKIAWCWYGVVAILAALWSPDKEAAAVFVFLGYYPMVKPWFDRFRLGWSGKLLLFNCAIGIMYFLLLKLFGMAALAEEYAQLGLLGGGIMLIMGNATFFLLDRVLTILSGKK